MATVTATQRIQPRDLVKCDLQRYSDPHPLVWATEIVMRDEWEVVAYRRPLVSAEIAGEEVTVYVQQGADRDSQPDIALETSLVAVKSANDFRALADLYDLATSRIEPFLVDANHWRLRPGSLELLAEHIGTTDDGELATHLGIPPLALALGRAGYSPWARWADYESLGQSVIHEIERLGFADSRYGRSVRLAMVSAPDSRSS